jgi:uncharacterized membrane protein
MTAQTDMEKRNVWLQYINTGILSAIFGFAMMIFISLNNIKSQQLTMMEKVIKLEVTQLHNVSQVDDVDARVKILEINFTNELKIWVDENYVRKTQSK